MLPDFGNCQDIPGVCEPSQRQQAQPGTAPCQRAGLQVKTRDKRQVITRRLLEPSGSDIDGHDAGGGELNIFIRTDDPRRTFDEVKSTLLKTEFWLGVRVAHRTL
jgi:hypothetical protein